MATRSILSTRSEKGTSLTSRSAVTVVTSIFHIQPVDLCTSITLSVIFVSFLKIKFSSVHYKHVAPCKIFVKAHAFFFLPLKLSQASCSQVFPVCQAKITRGLSFMFTEHIRECQQYTDYYLCKKHKCDLKDCIETYLLVVVFLNCTTLTKMDSCLFKALLHLLQHRCLKDIKDTYSSKKNNATKNHIIKMTSQMESKELT